MNKILAKLNNDLSNDSQLFFEKMGGFHDAIVHSIEIDIKNKSLKLILFDPFANFEGEKEYVFIDKFIIEFEFRHIKIDAEYDSDELTIYDIIGGKDIAILFSPSGRIELNINKVHIIA